MNKNTGASLPGTAEKIIQSPLSNAPDKSQIKVLGAAHDRRGIRIDNPLTNENGEEVSIKMSAQVNLLSEQACRYYPWQILGRLSSLISMALT